jgi:hypothetical protein
MRSFVAILAIIVFFLLTVSLLSQSSSPPASQADVRRATARCLAHCRLLR